MKTGNDAPSIPPSRMRVSDAACEALGLDRREVAQYVGALIATHTETLAQGGANVKKNAPETAVTLVSKAGFPTVCVKEFRFRGIGYALKGIFRATQGLRAFRAGLMSIERGVPAPRPLIWLREGFGPIALREFLIMEVIPGAREFDRFLVGELDAGRLRGSDKASLIRAFAEFVARLHGKGIFHRDLKTCNLLGSRGANEGDFSFALLDYDDLSFPGVVSETRRIKNLAQLFLSTPVAFGRSDRSRFLRHYCREARYGNARKKRLARGVLESVLGKRILFVGFDGDVVETL